MSLYVKSLIYGRNYSKGRIQGQAVSFIACLFLSPNLLFLQISYFTIIIREPVWSVKLGCRVFDECLDFNPEYVYVGKLIRCTPELSVGSTG